MYQQATLSNGLRIVCESIPQVHSVSLGVWVGTGSRYEEPEINGISHFLEHMLFKGTTNRTAKQIAETIDAVGGQLNAFTTKEYTCFYAKVLGKHFQLGVDLLSDMITNSVLSVAELEKEKSVILEEIKSYEDSPDELIHDLFVEQVLKNHSLGRSILGTPETVDQINQSTLIDYLNHHYTPDNIVFAVAGNIQFNQVIAEVEARFSKMTGKVNHQYPEIPPLQAGKTLRNKETEQVHLCMGTRGFGRKNPKKYALFVLDSILGGSVSSRLFQRLREEEGMVYVTGSNHSSFIDTGVFTIYAGTSLKNYQPVVSMIEDEVSKLRDCKVPADELYRAKEQIKGNLLLSLESTCNRMSRIAKMELFKDSLLTPEETVAKIDAVTIEMVQEVAQEILDEKRIVQAAIGPFEEVS